MSLFGNNQYQYRETYFVLFAARNLPGAEKLQEALGSLGPRYETVNLAENENGFESLTVKSHRDFAAVDIVLTQGAEVIAQVQEVLEAARTMTLTGEDSKKISRLREFDSRFDVFHFEEIATATDDDQFLDPGGLLLVLDALAGLCKGVAMDPQTMSVM